MGIRSTGKLAMTGIWVLRALALVLVAGSLVSTTDYNQWWIRIWDFPRIQIFLLMAATGAALWFFDRGWRPWLPVIIAGFAVWQAYRIFPYTGFAPSEVALVEAGEVDEAACFSILTLNVLQKNRDYRRTIDLIERSDADIVLLTETDQAWADALAPALSGYPGQIARPIDNTYGMLLATRLPMRDASIQDLAQADTPSVFATLSVGGHDFRMMGLHPRPPQPKQDTEERDAELIVAARMAREMQVQRQMPVLALGDFNDVAWSDTTRLFTDLGGFLDPRKGRGTYATFPAGAVWLGWPLDHLFATEEFLLQSMSVGESVGSDHRPVHARMCLSPANGRMLNDRTERPDSGDEEDADEVMEEFREDEAEDAVEGEEG